jgi:Domain of unknown function (DUF4329)
LIDPLGLLPGDCYVTQNAAGANAVNDINWKSIQNNVEYAGRVYQNPDGTYSYTAPQTQNSPTRSDPGPLMPNTVGTYHTHGATMAGYNGEAYSPADVGLSIGEGLNIPGYIAYLGTPTGVIKAFDPHSFIGDRQLPQFWNLPYPTPGQAAGCGCTNKRVNVRMLRAKHLFVVCWLLVISGICGAQSKDDRGAAVVAVPRLFQVASVAYRDFDNELKEAERKSQADGKSQSESQRHFSDITNYTMELWEYKSRVYVTFTLRPFQGRGAFGGPSRYVLDEKTAAILEHAGEK